MQVRTKRIYESFSATDGLRVLVDRIWPRGINKYHAHINLWLKDIAPSDDLRRRFHKNTDLLWTDFQESYLRELEDNNAEVNKLIKYAGNNTITLVYASKDTEHNNALVLATYISKITTEAD